MKIHYIDVAKVSHIVNGRKPFALGVVKPERHNLRLIVGGQSPKQYAPRLRPSTASTPDATGRGNAINRDDHASQIQA